MAAAVVGVAPPADLFEQSSLFKGLPAAFLTELRQHLRQRNVTTGSVIVREGEPGDCYYLILSGEAEAWVLRGGLASAGDAPPAASGGTPHEADAQGGLAGDAEAGPPSTVEQWEPDPKRYALAERLGPGDGFGEAAVLLGAKQPATVRAATDLVLYTLDGPTFLRLAHEQQGLEVALHEEMALRAVDDFLGEASPFACLPPEALRWLATRLQVVSFQPGEVIVRQGEPGDALYILRAGHAAVIVRRADGTEYQSATLGPGDVFGEQSLLTDEPRPATVRATDAVGVLRLDQADFFEVLRRSHDRARYFVQLTQLRQRPRRKGGVEVDRRSRRDGSVTYVLNDTESHRFAQVSEQGIFLWNLMDGDHTIRELAMAYFQEYQAFGLYPVLRLVQQLHLAGFVAVQDIDRERLGPTTKSTVRQRILMRPLPWISRYYSLPDVDRAITWVYRRVARPLYWPPVQVLLLVAIGAGSFRLLRYLTHGGAPPTPTNSWHVLAALGLLGMLVQGALHEMGHALTTKHFGKGVHHAGIGWYFFMPVGFTDTSEMWTASRLRRMAVDIAGPYVNFLLGSIATLLTLLVTDPVGQAALFHFALVGFIIGVVNLNPLIEMDGYYVLMDAMDVPNLRTKALAFLGGVLWRQHPTAPTSRLGRLYEGYGVLVLAYVAVIAITILRVWETHVESVVSAVMPHAVSVALGYTAAGAMAFLILLRTWKDLRGGAAAARKADALEL
jgi:CRP-like cAMP-binding protein/Zn-dependent protease